jgi:hypothetical protein
MPLPKYIKTYDTLSASVAGYIAVYLYTKYSGVGISPDSIMYASTAHNIATHGSLLTFNGGPLVFFPVFYPFFLSVILFITRIPTFNAAPVINGLLFAGVIFLSGYLVSRFKNYSGIYKWLILIDIVLSPGLLEIYSYLWSETLFIFMVMLYMLAHWHYMQKHTTGRLLLLTLIIAIGCITRYAGVTMILSGGLLLLFDPELPVRKKITHILIFGFGSFSLLLANLIKNRLSTGLSTGTREPAITPFSQNMYYFGKVICDWMGLPQTAYPYSIVIGSLVLLCLTALLLWRLLKIKVNSAESIVLAFAVVYGFFIPVLATFSRFEPLNSRLLSPLYIAALIGITSWLPGILHGKSAKTKALIYVPFIALMLLFEYSIAQTDYQRYDDEFDYGVPGYSDDDWNGKPFINFLKTHPNIYKPGIPRYSDADEAVYFFSGGTAKLLPHRYFTNTVSQFFAVKHFYLIWFDTLNNTELIGIKDIEEHGTLKKLYSFPEGAVYEYYANVK